MSNLKNHQANQSSINYAKENKISIAELKSKESSTYKILNSQEILAVDKHLEAQVVAIFEILFKEREIFRIEGSNKNTLNKLLAFPELDKEELELFWEKLNILLEHKSLLEKNIYFRVVNNLVGEEHQLAFPIESSNWRGQENLLIGPFENKKAAEAWASAALENYNNLDYDHINYNGKEFVDIFSNLI